MIFVELEWLCSVRNNLSLEGNLCLLYQDLSCIKLIDYPHVLLSTRKTVPTLSELTTVFTMAFMSKFLHSNVKNL